MMRGALIRSIAVTVGLAAIAGATAGAQSLTQQGILRPDLVHPIIFTVSGGISRGSYQGGLNWGLVEVARRSTYDEGFRRWMTARNPNVTAPSLVLAAAGGASAGNINSLLSAVEWCRSGQATPAEESLFWKAWVWTGWDQLMLNANGVRFDEHGIFDRLFFDTTLRRTIADDIGKKIPFRARCRVPVGITTTRLLADTITISTDIQASSQRFAIPFLVGTGDDRVMFFHQVDTAVFRDPTMGEMIVLHSKPSQGGTAVDLGFQGVFKAVEASSAFPLAFAPRTLVYNKPADIRQRRGCTVSGSAWGCTRADTAQFLDGGVFDNNPLGVAYGLYRCMPFNDSTAAQRHEAVKVAQSGAPRGAPAAVDADTTLHCPAPPRRATLVYMDPDARRDGSGMTIRINLDTGHVHGLEPLRKLVGGAVETGRQYELAVFSRTVKLLPNARLLEQVATDRYQAIVGDHFGAFGAFLGRPFREFDFYAGVYDAFYFTGSEAICRPADAQVARQQTKNVAGDIRDCIRNVIESATCDDVFAIENVGRVVIAQLFQQEFKRPISCAARLAGTTRLDSARATVLRAVGRGNERIRSIAADTTRATWLDDPRKRTAGGKPDPFGCKPKAFIQRQLCGAGFSLLLHELSQDSIRWALDTLAEHPACDMERMTPDSLTHLRECRVDETVYDLATNSIPAADALGQGVLNRLARVERYDLETMVDAATLAFYVGRNDDLRGGAFFSSRIPNTGGFRNGLARVVPFHLTAILGTRSVVTGLRPTFYSRRAVDLVFPLEFAHFVANYPEATGTFRARTINTLNAGAGFLFPGFLVFDYVQVNGFTSFRNSSRCTAADNIGGEASTALLLGHLRLGYRRLGWCDRGRQRGGMIVGLSDLNGLVYWILRMRS